MKFDKVIYFMYLPLTQKVFHDYYMEELLRIEIKVEYWDLSALFFRKNNSLEDSSYLIKTIKFSDYQEVEIAIRRQNLERTLFISIVTYEGRVIRLYKLLTKYDCKLGAFGCNMCPTSVIRPLFRRLKKITPYRLLNYINNRRAKRLKNIGKIKSCDILFIGGNKGWKTIGMTSPLEIDSAQKIIINTQDYEESMVLKEAPRIINGDYVLFLDQYVPFHPDLKIIREKGITSEQYYPLLNHYFDKIEENFGIPVIIAAHPKALKYKEENYFNGRAIYFGKSAILSRDAKFVLAHNSTSISFSVAFGTPLHFITSRIIEKKMPFMHHNIINFAKYLNCKWQYFDNNNEPIKLAENHSVDAYLDYKYDFLSSKETENKLSRDIIIDYFVS